MFKELILNALAAGPKRTEELYEVAMAKQPDDCTASPCPHRDVPTDLEWQHELRREQQTLKQEGLIVREGDLWKLA